MVKYQKKTVLENGPYRGGSIRMTSLQTLNYNYNGVVGYYRRYSMDSVTARWTEINS